MENTKTIKQTICLDKLTNEVINYVNDIQFGTFVMLTSERIVQQGLNENQINSLISELSSTDPETCFPKVAFISENNSLCLTVSKNTEKYKFIEFNGENDPINQPSNGAIYDENKNAFIRPCPVEGYILNESTFEWEPDPSITYDLHDDAKQYRYDAENNCWWPTW